jgi:hypothetical protein
MTRITSGGPDKNFEDGPPATAASRGAFRFLPPRRTGFGEGQPGREQPFFSPTSAAH